MHRQPILTEHTVAAWDFLALPEGVAQMWGKTDPPVESAPGHTRNPHRIPSRDQGS